VQAKAYDLQMHKQSMYGYSTKGAKTDLEAAGGSKASSKARETSEAKKSAEKKSESKVPSKPASKHASDARGADVGDGGWGGPAVASKAPSKPLSKTPSKPPSKTPSKPPSKTPSKPPSKPPSSAGWGGAACDAGGGGWGQDAEAATPKAGW
jgi:hypothetical protein